jgi:hypothetical protein
LIMLIGGMIYSCENSSTQNNEKKMGMPSLLNTKWQFKIADECINYYLFKKDSSSIYYSCESDDKYYGKYYVKRDTLYIHNFVTDTDSLLSSMESEHKSQQAKYKLVFNDNKLKHLERWSYSVSKDLWTKDDFDFGDDFLFEKVK